MQLKPLIIFENDDFVVLNKPSGLLSIPDRLGKEVSLKLLLQQQFGEIFTVHRLDKDTSGIIVFAKNALCHAALTQAFENREVEKFYYGLVQGKPLENEGSITASIQQHPAKDAQMWVHAKGKESLTTYVVEQVFKQYSWIKFQLHTGRTHQIRVHCQFIGCPIVVDGLYGQATPILLSQIKKKFHLGKFTEEEKPLLNRLGLHAFELRFSYNNKHYNFQAPLPKDLRATLQQLAKN